MAQLAAAIEGVLGPSSSGRLISSAASGGGSDVPPSGRISSTHHGQIPARAFFLEDVSINPRQRPPATELIDSLRDLRRKCGDALRWAAALQSRAAKVRPSDGIGVVARLVSC